MASATDFAKMVPGFEFLQGVMKNAGVGLPPMGQWIAPTLDPAELQKRIDELRTVQFWLEQNAKLLGTTIQALEVQRMTLSTLQTMNLPLADLRDALTAPGPRAAAPARAEAPAAAPARGTARRTPKASPATAQAAARPAAVDPMQWWGALTGQFAQLAASALKDSAGDAARQFAGAVVKQGIDSAGETIKKAAGVAATPVKAAARVAGAAAGAAAGVAASAAGAASAAAKSRRRAR